MAMLHPEEAGAWIQDANTRLRMEHLQEALRDDVFKICDERAKGELARPKWLPMFVTADFLFGLVHLFFLAVVVSAIIYSYLFTFCWHTKPDWRIMKLVKMTYPMGPVVLGCWASRTLYGHRNTDGTKDHYHEAGGRRKWWRMTPGYYFANLKMALLPSLGPGLIINFILGKGIVRTSEYIESDTYRAFCESFSWVAGCFIWGTLAHIVGDGILSAESKRKDYGVYEELYVHPRSNTHWSEWIHKGPHLVFFVIPCPEHGTILKVAEANVKRTLGITFFVLVVWASLFEVWTRILSEESKQIWHFRQHPWAATLLETDLSNLIVNTLTMPFLIWYTWRKEPREVLLGVKRRPSLTNLLKPRAAKPAETQQGLIANDRDEKEEILVKVVSALMNYPVYSLLCYNPEAAKHLGRAGAPDHQFGKNGMAAPHDRSGSFSQVLHRQPLEQSSPPEADYPVRPSRISASTSESTTSVTRSWIPKIRLSPSFPSRSNELPGI